MLTAQEAAQYQNMGFMGSIFADFFKRLEESRHMESRNKPDPDTLVYRAMMSVLRGESLKKSSQYEHKYQDIHREARTMENMFGGSAIQEEEMARQRKAALRQEKALMRKQNRAAARATENSSLTVKNPEAFMAKDSDKSAVEIREARIAKYSGDIQHAERIESKTTAVSTQLEA